MLIAINYLFKKYDIKPEGILHLGGSSGQERDSYAELGIKNVIWVEAIPEVYKQLCENTEDIDGTICINACVSDRDGEEVEFKVSNNEGQSSSILDFAHHAIIHPTVKYIDRFKIKTARVDTLLKDFNFEGRWLLNADLQGTELQAIKGMGELINKFDWLYLELNFKECYRGCALVGEVDAYLLTKGFVRRETAPLVAESWTDGLYTRI